MGKRVDNILIIEDIIFVIEFKVGQNSYDTTSINQLIDYVLDLKNFHEGSHNKKLVPILVATDAPLFENQFNVKNNVYLPFKVNQFNFNKVINQILEIMPTKNNLDVDTWESSKYKPTPTIVEAAQALYRGHNVEEISRHGADKINLSLTSSCLNEIIDFSKSNNKKSICFVTGVPGAGKTLAGLNVANGRMNTDKEEQAVFLSGNGPLVQVLREALAQDKYKHLIEIGQKIKIDDARRDANSFIQNIHHFRDEYLKDSSAPIEKVVVFDEAQRAWNTKETSRFIKGRGGDPNFNMSEPQFLISVMDRHQDWCCIVCLIGGGQEINKGEAGIQEWLIALKKFFSDWDIYYSNAICSNPNYLPNVELNSWLLKNGTKKENLHLSTCIRSFRAMQLSEFVEKLLNLNKLEAQRVFEKLNNKYPIVISRDLKKCKQWLKEKAMGNERTGILISSSARRMRSLGLDAENGIRSNSGKDKIAQWFLNSKDDIRSSSFLELPATQFAVQGLELDGVCLAWGGDLSFQDNNWVHKYFTGNSWKYHNTEEKKRKDI
ncbi:DUF2075 domain-containing protein [Aureispira sp. CCB-E]|nr:DNA/RNA helicase domain-containing protein [Aureispira sp. CCB-E]WMX13136.1 DUF2075 domain-containing protein [Aureispira sp. CCB-E]